MYLGIESTSKSKINIYFYLYAMNSMTNVFFYLTADQLSSSKNKIATLPLMQYVICKVTKMIKYSRAVKNTTFTSKGYGSGSIKDPDRKKNTMEILRLSTNCTQV